MRAKPPVNSEVRSEEKKRDFISGSEKKQEIESNLIPNSEGDYPWNDEKVRADVTRTFNVRLSEPDYLKLKYIADNTPESMHTFCLNALIPEIEKQIKKLTW